MISSQTIRFLQGDNIGSNRCYSFNSMFFVTSEAVYRDSSQGFEKVTKFKVLVVNRVWI